MTFPGDPAGLLRFSESGEEAQLDGSSPLAAGLIRSSEPEKPSAPIGHGALSAYRTVSTTLPEASESSSRSPLLLNRPLKIPATGAS